MESTKPGSPKWAKLGQERRMHQRYGVEPDVELMIMLPEQTFRPQGLKGKLVDASLGGMLVRLDQVMDSLYKSLLMETRHIRAVFTNPYTGDATIISGRIVWINYQSKDTSGEGGGCEFGICLTDCPISAAGAYSNFMNNIEAAHRPPEAETR